MSPVEQAHEMRHEREALTATFVLALLSPNPAVVAYVTAEVLHEARVRMLAGGVRLDMPSNR